MTEQVTDQTEDQKSKHEIILYEVCGRDFVRENIYGRGGLRPNAKYIAHEHGCELEFRESEYIQTGLMSITPSYLERLGIGSDGSCLSAFLVGDDREKLTDAKVDIHRTFGVRTLDFRVDIGGVIDIGREKSSFC
ncbi:MAG: hypothetical protein AABW89_00790 [Nanoarchaeota archaeon]